MRPAGMTDKEKARWSRNWNRTRKMVQTIAKKKKIDLNKIPIVPER